MTSPLADAINALPSYISAEDLETLPQMLNALSSKMQTYEDQSAALFFYEFIKNQAKPACGFEMSIDKDDGIYYLYTGGEDGVEVDEDDFESDEALEDYQRQKNEELEGFAQQINDSPWRESGITEDIVEALNRVAWDADQAEEVIARVLSEYVVDGKAFLVSIQATKDAKDIAANTPTTSSKQARRGL